MALPDRSIRAAAKVTAVNLFSRWPSVKPCFQMSAIAPEDLRAEKQASAFGVTDRLQTSVSAEFSQHVFNVISNCCRADVEFVGDGTGALARSQLVKYRHLTRRESFADCC